jgi:phage-related protein (TIGR01555 family)
MRFARLRRWLATQLAPPIQTVTEQLADLPEARGVSMMALAEASAGYGQPLQAFHSLPAAAPGVMPTTMAMDAGVPAYASQAAGAIMQWGLESRFHEGMAFLGFPYLAELAQRSEYRKMTETIARDATRKWMELKGPDETKLKALKDAIITHGVRAKLQHVAELDGYFGRGQIFVDVGETNLRTAMVIDKKAIGKGKLKGFTVVEPVWTYPGEYNATEPLKPDFFVPREWYVMGDIIHRSRLLVFIAREVPDMLKATYAFGGLSMSQMAKPYVDNWLRTRQSVSDLIHSFSTMVLKTDMASILTGGPAANVLARLQLYTQFRDNRGVFAVDKESEELENVSAPLANLDDLQTQAQEQMCTVSGVPRLLLLGLSPKGSGIGDSGQGEIQAYFGYIIAYQERFFRPHLTTIINLIQLDLWGEVDPLITFEFHPLQEMDLKELAEIRKSDAEAITLYVNAGCVSPDEAREVISEDENGLFFGVDLSAPAPEQDDDTDVLNGPPDAGGG